jgi:eukaryotic-like serine/threonine-protein kinase
VTRAALAVAVVVAGIALAGAPAAPKPKGTKATATRATAKKPAAARKASRGDGGSNALELGTLELSIKGSVTAYLDGRELGKTPLKPVKVLAGAHKLRLVNEELKIDQSMDVEVEPNQRQTLEISFE